MSDALKSGFPIKEMAGSIELPAITRPSSARARVVRVAFILGRFFDCVRRYFPPTNKACTKSCIWRPLK